VPEAILQKKSPLTLQEQALDPRELDSLG